MPSMTCTPCSAVFLITRGIPPLCSYCLGDLAPATALDVTRAVSGKSMNGDPLAPHGECYRALKLRHYSLAAMEANQLERARLRSLLAENAVLREELRANLAEMRAAGEGS